MTPKVDIPGSLHRQAMQAHETYTYYIEHTAEFESVVKAFEDVNVTYVNASPMFLYVGMAGTREDLLAACEKLRECGFRPDKKEGEISALAANWDNTFRTAKGATVYLAFSSSVCKRVKVGTKMVEQDVYEIQCGEPQAPTVTEQAEAAVDAQIAEAATGYA